MPQTIAEERFRWIKPILGKETTIKSMVKVCPFSERTLKYWLTKYRKEGLKGLENKSRRPRTSPKETPIRVKERVIELRKRTSLCAKKLSWRLEKDGIIVHPRTIGKIIKKEGLTRRYRTKKVKYKYLKFPLRPGELVEVDIKYVPHRIKGLRYYQFTAIDCSSRWRYLRVYDDKSSTSSLKFLRKLREVSPFKIKAIKTDNDSCFTNRYTGYLKVKSSDPHPRLHPFDILCAKEGIIHYLIDPGKPSQNGKVERSHRTDQEMFYDRIEFKSFNDLKQRIRSWNLRYNNLEHCGLNGLSPNEFLRICPNNPCPGLGVQNVCT